MEPNKNELGEVIVNPNEKLEDSVGEQIKDIFTGERKSEVEVPRSYVKPETIVDVKSKVKKELSETDFVKDLTVEDKTDLQMQGIVDVPITQGDLVDATSNTNLMPPSVDNFDIVGKPYSILTKNKNTNETEMLKYTRLKKDISGQLLYSSPVENKKASLSLNVPVKITGKDDTTIQTILVDVDGMEKEEAHDHLMQIYNGYKERARANYPTPNFQSSEEYPLKFTNTGLDVRVERNPINSVVGFKDNIVREVLKRDAVKIFEPIYDITIDMAIGEGLPYLYELGATKLASMKFYYERDFTKANREKYEDTLDRIHTNSQGFADAIPSGKYILEAILGNKPTLKEFERGFAALREEDVGNFIDGKNDSYFIKFFKEYATAAAFLKTTNVLLGTVGLGPKGGKDLVKILRGEKEPKGKYFTRLKKNNKEFKSGYDFWKMSLKKADLNGKSEEQLKNAWFSIPASQQSHFINKSFSDLTEKVMRSGGLQMFGKTRLRMLNTRKNWGLNVREFNRETGMELMTEAVVVTGVGAITDNPIYVLPAFVGATIGSNVFYNRNRWKKISQRSTSDTVVKRSIRAVGSFGEGFASGSDALLYAITGGKTDVTDIVRRGAMQRVRKQYPGKSTQWYEDYLHTEEGIPSENFNQILPSFLMTKVIDGKEQEVLITAGDREYDALQEISDEINKIDNVELKNTVIERIGAFNIIQNRIGEIARQMDKPEVAENLSTALYEVLDLFTTTSLVKTMAERADFKFMSAYDLRNAETLYQNRKSKIDAVSNLLSDFSKQAETMVIGDKIKGAVEDIKKAIKGEQESLADFKADLDSTEATLDATSAVGTLQQDSVVNLVSKHTQKEDVLSSKIGDALAAGQNIDKLLLKHRNLIRENLLSISDNIKTNHSFMTKELKATGRAQVWETTERLTDHIANTRAKLIYGNLYKISAKENLETKEIENLVLQFDDAIDLDPVDILKGRKLPSRLKTGSLLLFENALIKQGDSLRNKLMEGLGLDNLDDVTTYLRGRGIKVNLNSNFDLYRTYLRMKNGIVKSDGLFMAGGNIAFKDASFKANTLVEMDQAIAGQIRKLNRNDSRSNTQNEELQILLSLQGQVRQSLTNKFGPLYQNTTKAYRLEIGRKKDRQDGVHVKRNNIIPSDGIVLADDITQAVYNKSPEEQMYNMGKDILENGGDVSYTNAVHRHGTLAKTNNAEDIVTLENGEVIPNAKYIIADGDEAFMANIRMNMAVEQYVYKRMQEMQKKHSVMFKDMDELPIEVKEFLGSFFNGPMRENLIKYQNRFNIPDGVEVWDQKTLLENGDFNRTTNVAYLRDRNNKIISSVKDNANKNQISFDNLNNRLAKPLAIVKESSEDYKKYYNAAIKNIEQINRTIKGTLDRDFKIQENALKETVNFLLKLNVPLDAGGATPKSIADAITADGTGQTARALRDLIVASSEDAPNIVAKYKTITTKKGPPSKKGFDFGQSRKVETSVEEKTKQANLFIKNLVMHKFVDDVLEPAGMKHPVADIKTGEYISSKQQYIINPTEVAKARKKYGGIITEFADKELQMIQDIGDYLSFDIDVALKTSGALGQKMYAKMLGTPRAMTVAAGLARVFSVIRDVVSPRYVGMEAMIRTARMMKADDAKTLLTSKMTVKLPGDKKAYTALDIIHDLLVNNNYTVKNAQRMEKLLPLVIYESEIDVNFYPTDKKIIRVTIPVPVIDKRKGAEYTPKRPEGQPIIRVQPEDIQDKYKDQMNKIFQ